MVERERLRELFIQALEQLSQVYKSMLDYNRALNLSLRLIQVDPLIIDRGCNSQGVHTVIYK